MKRYASATGPLPETASQRYKPAASPPHASAGTASGTRTISCSSSEPFTAPVNECFTALTALAATVPRLRIGSLVAGNTYRHPALVAKVATGIDRISGGRFVLGLGAGWQAEEHERYGLAFPTLRARMDRLEEACVMIRALLDSDGTPATFDGVHYRLRDAPLSPAPPAEALANPRRRWRRAAPAAHRRAPCRRVERLRAARGS